MCADFEVQVINEMYTGVYPLPCIETFFSKIADAKFFAKIDLANAYWQSALDEKSQNVFTVNRTRGLFRDTRLSVDWKLKRLHFNK